MNAKLDPTDITTTLWALDVLRRYAPQPIVDDADYHAVCFKRLCANDAAVRELMAEREVEPAVCDPRSDEQYFLEEQCPSESYFGR